MSCRRPGIAARPDTGTASYPSTAPLAPRAPLRSPRTHVASACAPRPTRSALNQSALQTVSSEPYDDPRDDRTALDGGIPGPRRGAARIGLPLAFVPGQSRYAPTECSLDHAPGIAVPRLPGVDAYSPTWCERCWQPGAGPCCSKNRVAPWLRCARGLRRVRHELITAVLARIGSASKFGHDRTCGCSISRAP